MVRFYRLALGFACLFSSIVAFGQVPVAVEDNPPPTPEDTPTSFNVTDNDTEILSAIDPATVDLDLGMGGIQNTFTNSDGNWIVDNGGNVTYTPTLNFNGPASIPYTVQNTLIIPVTSLPANINVSVTPVNDDPTITPITDQAIAFNSSTPAINFTLGDVETPGSLTVSGSSNNAALVPDANILIAGSGTSRTVTVTPTTDQSGSATITLTVDDGTSSATTDFLLTVAANVPPTISTIGNQSTLQDTPTGAIAFTIGDAETAPGSLTVSGSSSDVTLVPNTNIAFGGSGANRTVTITPAAGQSGTSTITVTVSDGTDNASTNFVLTVNAPNTPPTISAIGNQSTLQDTPTGAIAFTIGDAETAPGSLTVSGSSSDVTLVPNTNIAFGGSGANRTVTITPAAGQSGTSTITVTVSDGTDNASTNFVLTVNAPNTPPTISAIGNQSTLQDTPTGAIAFTIGDAETAPGSLTVSGSSSDVTLVPNTNIAFGGSGANRTVTITPAAGQSGTSTITVTVSDGTDNASTNFVLTVNAPNTPPTISAIGNQSTLQDTPTGAIAFTIGDAETAPGSLTVSGSSSDVTLVPNTNIAFGGSGANRTITLTPAAGQSGTSTITVTVSDGTDNASTNFVLTVNAPNTPPTISAIGNQSTLQDTPTGAIAFTIGDAETAPGSLTVSGSSSDVTLVPNTNIAFGGSGANRTVTITPAAGQSGTSTITVTVSDGTDNASTNFVLTVNAPNTPPTISAIGNQSTPENTPTVAIPFTIGDAETAPGSLTVSGSSSDVTLVPNTNIAFGGSGANRTVTITPAAGQSGTSTITVTVSDGTDNASTNFVLTVNAPNTPPTISAIGNQSTPENTPTVAIPFTIGDAETAPGSLTVSGSSSDVTLVPNTNIAFGGSGANRTITLTPAAGQSGTSIITVTVSDGTDATSINFTLTVDAVNDPPTISAISNQSTSENTPTGAIGFTVGDPDNAPATLTVTGSSSNTTLVPDANIIFGGSGANRTVTLTPAIGSGTTTITLTVSDGTATASTDFVLTVSDVNDSPTISAISDQTTTENTPTAAIPFTITDAETPAGSLTLTASSSNTSVVPVANITFGGSGANRTVTIDPGASQSGTATITITVSDGTASASTAFALTINPINDAPTITPISDQTTAENTPTADLPFNIGDAETPAANLTVSASSSVTTLVSNGNIVLAGTGSDRTITITPTAGQSGTTDITITVSDGAAVTSTTFTLTVTSVNDAPTITAISNQTTNEDTPTPALPFTVGDADTPAANLTVTATSSNTTLVPDANIALFGNDISRTVTATPAANQSGTTTITLTVSDGTGSTSTSFQLTVTPINDPPAITAISDQMTAENTPTGAIAFNVSDGESPATSLVVTTSSSDVVLVPNANISVGGSGEARTVTVTPVNGRSGATTITLTVSDGTDQATTSFTLTVTAVNDAPTITAIPAQTTNEDVATIAISFTIGDAESPASSLTVTGASSNKTLVPDASIIISGNGATRTVTITPAANQNGNTSITLTVSDGTASAQTQFQLNVTPVDDAPLITAQFPLTTPENTPITLVPGNFTIVDPDNSSNALSLVILPGSNFTSSGATISPGTNFVGELSVIVRAFDGKNSSPEFIAKIMVTDVNFVPQIVAQDPDPISLDVGGSLDFGINYLIIDDDDDPISSLTVKVLPGDNYLLSGSDLTRITPSQGHLGPLDVVVTVSDGKSESAPFTVDVRVVQPSALPSITGQVLLIIDEDSSLPLTLDDLIVSDADDNYPNGFTLNVGPGENFTVDGNVITPTLNHVDELSVPVTVNDGENPSNTFRVRVFIRAINDAPEITALESNALLYEPGSGPTPLTDIFECVDVDSDFLNIAEIGFVEGTNYNPDNDELIFENSDTSPIRGVYDPAKGVLSLIGYANKDEYIAAIRSIHYNYKLTVDINGEPSQISTEPKEIYFTVSDGPEISDARVRSIELEIAVELSIPNAFTPNGDVSNDTWAVQPYTNSDQFNDTVVKVYNKRGLLVYEAVGLENKWDGTFNGELLPVDTYFYTIDLKLSFIKKTYKGAVMILR